MKQHEDETFRCVRRFIVKILNSPRLTEILAEEQLSDRMERYNHFRTDVIKVFEGKE